MSSERTRRRIKRDDPIPPAAAATTPTTGDAHTQRLRGVQTCGLEWVTPEAVVPLDHPQLWIKTPA